MTLPTRDSAVGRGIATFVQAIIGFAIVALSSTDVQTLVNSQYPKYAAAVSGIVGVLSFVNNWLRKDVPNV